MDTLKVTLWSYSVCILLSLLFPHQLFQLCGSRVTHRQHSRVSILVELSLALPDSRFCSPAENHSYFEGRARGARAGRAAGLWANAGRHPSPLRGVRAGLGPQGSRRAPKTGRVYRSFQCSSIVLSVHGPGAWFPATPPSGRAHRGPAPGISDTPIPNPNWYGGLQGQMGRLR